LFSNEEFHDIAYIWCLPSLENKTVKA
jgi:hypothetical protein